MAITSVERVWSGETFSDELSGAREYEIQYRVHSNDPEELAVTVRNHPDIAAKGSAFEGDPEAICTGRRATRPDNSRLIWDVTAAFAVQENPGQDNDNPLNDPVQIRWTSSLYTRPVIRDNDGDAIVNSAGDFFDPPPEKTFVMWTANIQFNVSARPAGIRAYAGAVNNDAITIDGDAIAARRARVMGLDITEYQYRNDIPFKTVTVAIDCLDDDDPDGFDLVLLDQGFRTKVAGVLKDILIEDEDNEWARPSSPVLLNGAGGQLGDPSPSSAVFLTFQVSKLRDLTYFPGVT
jgi:hypothetical protein